MTICWNCKSDIGDLYKICPICLTMLDEIVCCKCGGNKTNICTTPGPMYGKPIWIESEGEDEFGNWDGNYLCHECKLKTRKHKGEEEKGEGKERLEKELEDLKKDKIDLNYINPNNIQSCRQNIPELIVRDCIREFNFDEEQAERMRMILLARGTNKWFYARREFIRLKHQVKEMLKSTEFPYNDKKVHRTVEKIYTKMQNIAHIPRWIWWPTTITHKWKKIEDNIIIKER